MEALGDLHASKYKRPHKKLNDGCLWKPPKRNNVGASKQLRFVAITETFNGNQPEAGRGCVNIDNSLFFEVAQQLKTCTWFQSAPSFHVRSTVGAIVSILQQQIPVNKTTGYYSMNNCTIKAHRQATAWESTGFIAWQWDTGVPHCLF